MRLGLHTSSRRVVYRGQLVVTLALRFFVVGLRDLVDLLRNVWTSTKLIRLLLLVLLHQLASFVLL